MQFTYSNSNNYLAGAKEVNDISTNIYNTSRQTGVDVNNLIQTERKARATKADAKNTAEGTIGRTAVNTLAGIKKGDIERKSKKDVENIMKPAKRMAASGIHGVDLLSSRYVAGHGAVESLRIHSPGPTSTASWS